MTPAQLATLTDIFGEEGNPFLPDYNRLVYNFVDYSWPVECSNDSDVLEQLRGIKAEHPDAQWWRDPQYLSWCERFVIHWNPTSS